MDPLFLALLRCPFCSGTLNFKPAPLRKPLLLDSGVLRCGCSAFPVIDGIPVFHKKPVGVFDMESAGFRNEGASIARLVESIEAGRTVDALLDCLEAPSRIGRAVLRRMPEGKGDSARLHSLIRYPFRLRLRALLERRERIGVRELLDLWFHKGSFLGETLGHYFYLRFCQPRHLAALSLLETMPPSDKPILDIACGLGHLEHYLAQRPHPTACVGLDMSFFLVWIAKHWFAPTAEFVCADAGDGLPFAHASFSAALCSDAYHYIPNRPRLLSAIARCAPDAPVIVTRAGNLEVMPNEGAERDLDGYREEFGPHAGDGLMVFTEEELVRHHRSALNPFARQEKAPAGLKEAKWLTFAWNVTPAMREAVPDRRLRPHAVGRLGINPIYRVVDRNRGRTRLRFEFPLPWYAYENHGMLAYHPTYAEVPEAELNSVKDWDSSPQIKKLVDSYVLIGLPERFGA